MSTMIHVRIENDDKAQATKALAAMGLTVSDAVRVFLKRVVAEQALPFDLRVPNAATLAAMTEADQLLKARFSGPDELISSLGDGSDR